MPILPPKIAEITSRDRAKPMDMRPADFAASLAALRASDPANLSYISERCARSATEACSATWAAFRRRLASPTSSPPSAAPAPAEAGKRAQEIHSKLLDTFVDVLNSDVGKAAVSEFMLPGSGAALMASNGRRKRSEWPAAEPMDGKDADASGRKTHPDVDLDDILDA